MLPNSSIVTIASSADARTALVRSSSSRAGGLFLAALMLGAGAPDRGAEGIGGRLERLDLGGRPDAFGRVIVEPDEAPPVLAHGNRDHDPRQDAPAIEETPLELGEFLGQSVELPAFGQHRAPSSEAVLVRQGGRCLVADVDAARSEPLPVQSHARTPVLERDVLEHVDTAGARRRPQPLQDVGERGGPVVALEEPLGREPDRLQDGVATGEGVLGVLAGRDVEQDTLPHHRLPVGVAQQFRLVAHPHHASVATEEAVFGREGLAGLVRPLRELEDSVAVVRVKMVDPELRVPQPGARREAEQPLVLRADVERGAHLVDRVLVDHDRELFDQGPVVGLGLLEELLRDLALRDVEHHALVQGVAVVIASDGDRLVADPQLTAVARAHPILRTEGAGVPPGRRPFGLDTNQVVPVDEHGPQLWISELVRRIAEHHLDLGADERRGRIVTAVGGVPRVRHGGHAFHQRAIARLRLGEILLGALALGDVVYHSLR
jgi:hypothetical protein